MKFNDKITEEQAFLLNPIVLAFVGDAVYSLFVRLKLSVTVDKKSGALSEMAAKTVCADAQSKKAVELMSLFTERETAVFLRARNAKKNTRAKHSSVSAYHRSTGFEAVIGYLYLSGQTDRLDEILNYGETL